MLFFGRAAICAHRKTLRLKSVVRPAVAGVASGASHSDDHMGKSIAETASLGKKKARTKVSGLCGL